MVIIVSPIAHHRIVCYHFRGVALMLLFGHIGITIASVALGFGLKDKLRQATTGNGVEETSLIEYSHSSNKRLGSSASFFRSLANRFGVKFLLIGAIL